MASQEPLATWYRAAGELTIAHGGRNVFEGTLATAPEPAEVAWEIISRPAEPAYLGYSHGPQNAGGVPQELEARSLVVTITVPDGSAAELSGRVYADADSLACDPNGGPEIVRGSVGESRSALNRGVFDRAGDWAISVAEPALCSVTFEKPGEFAIRTSGSEIRLALDIDFIRNHRGYFHWNPEKQLWKEPVSGWCSWAAYTSGVTEQNVLDAADLLTRELKDYGYDIVQIDDGFQTFNQGDPAPLAPGEGVADFWLASNHRFPHGMAWMADQIAARGLTPGICMSSSLPLGMPDDWYVADPDGKPYKGPWVNYAINGLNADAVESAFRRTFRGLKEQGWRYFKVDTIRHIIYDSYRRVPGYWKSRGEDPELAFRSIFQAIADEIGPSIYMLSCWGTIPEMAGIPDGCRIGEDVGPSWDSVLKAAKHTAQFNYLNNIVWLNDPDYMCFRLPLEQARTWASFIALTGSQLMVSDPPADYDEPRLDILRKVGPPLFVRPTTLRSVTTTPELWLLEVYEFVTSYVVLGRFAWSPDGLPKQEITFAELGLDPERSYLVFDFWNERFIGEFANSFPSEEIPEGECRVYAIRRSAGHPQVLSTNRHIGQGAYELEDVTWNADSQTLSGKMKLPPKRPFSIFIHVPDGWKPVRTRPGAAAAPLCEGLLTPHHGQILKLTLASECGGSVEWSAAFVRQEHRLCLGHEQ